MPETIIYRYHDSPKTHYCWHYAVTILCQNIQLNTTSGAYPVHTWQQCLLGTPLPRRLTPGAKLWNFLCGTAVWLTWLDHNALCFTANNLSDPKIEQLLWEGVLNHTRMAWEHARTFILIHPDSAENFIQRFGEF
jgi:hypothetical protein